MPSMQFLPGEELAPAVIRELERRGMPAPTIYEKDAVLCWGWQRGDDGEPVRDWSDLRVFDLRLVGSGTGSEDAWVYAEALYTGGANEADWLGNSGRTCQGRFSHALYGGDVPKGRAYIDALLQFAKVHECDWARFMLAALHASTIMDLDADDLIDPAG